MGETFIAPVRTNAKRQAFINKRLFSPWPKDSSQPPAWCALKPKRVKMYHFIIKIRKCGRAVVLLFLRKRVQLRKLLCHFNLRNWKCICVADVLYLREINNEDVTQEYNNSFRVLDCHGTFLFRPTIYSYWLNYYQAICYSPLVAKSAGFENQNNGG